jgi:hypothetical protein
VADAVRVLLIKLVVRDLATKLGAPKRHRLGAKRKGAQDH